MNSMIKTKNIIRHLPDLYKSEDESSLSLLLKAFSRQLQQIETAQFEIMKAHWIDQAGNTDDLSGLGALFDVPMLEYEETEVYRTRLRDTIAAYLAGVGTKEVVMKITAVTLGLPEEEQHRIQIIENPHRMSQSELIQVLPNNDWPVKVKGISDAEDQTYPATVHITNISGEIKNPAILNLTTGFLVRFMGNITEDHELVIYPDLSAKLNDNDVSDKIVCNIVALFGQAKFKSAYFSKDVEMNDLGLVLPRGKSVWRFLSDDNTAHDPHSAEVQFEWTEPQPATFVIRLPWNIVDDSEKSNRRHLVKNALDKVKAAGVEAIVEYLPGEARSLMETQIQTPRLLALKSRLTLRDNQRQEDNLHMTSGMTYEEKHVTSERLTFRGVFNRTYLGSSRFK